MLTKYVLEQSEAVWSLYFGEWLRMVVGGSVDWDDGLRLYCLAGAILAQGFLRL